MNRVPTILEICDNPQLFRPWFRKPETWRSWRVFLAALFGLPIKDCEDLGLFKRCTGLDAPPPGGIVEAWLVCGRRAGKSFVLALVAIYLAVFRDWSTYLAPGERGVIKIIAVDRKQAKVIWRYCHALLTRVQPINAMIERDAPADGEIDLTNGVTIEVQAASFRSVRGYTLIAALCDELAFWRSEDSSNPDFEILAALRPAMSTIPGAMLLCASSPYSKRGALYEAHKRYFGRPGPVLVWHADTRTMNPTVSQRVIDDAMERDPQSAAAEYGAEWRSDIETFLSAELVDAAIDRDVIVRPPQPNINYVAGCDPSGGVGDSFTAAVAHVDCGVIALDALYEKRAPFNPAAAVGEIADLCRQYGIRKITGDRYAASWVSEAFAGQQITYWHSQKDRSGVYLDALPLFASGKVRLLDNSRLVTQLTGLERRTAPSGKDRVDHSIHGKDDVANAVCLALVDAQRPEQTALIACPIIIEAPRGFAEFASDGDTYSAYMASIGW